MGLVKRGSGSAPVQEKSYRKKAEKSNGAEREGALCHNA